MALPPVPTGYDSWNQYIEEQGAIIAAAQGLTFQQGKESVKCGDVAQPVRQAVGTPSYRIYNVWINYETSTHAPTEGRPWLTPDIPSGSEITTQSSDWITTQAGDGIVTT